MNLVELIGEVATVALAERFGGTRLYIRRDIREGSELADAIGLEAARKLSARFSPDVIRVPIMRELRAAHYRAEGLSNSKIATRLCMTEPGVNSIFKRLATQGKLGNL